MIVFATNVRPAELVDEAFLRRIHKIFAESPTVEDFKTIFAGCCRDPGATAEPGLVERCAHGLLPATQHSAARLPSAGSDQTGAVTGLTAAATAPHRRSAGSGVQQLLRERPRRVSRTPDLCMVSCLILTAVVMQAGLSPVSGSPTAATATTAASTRTTPAVRITSPLGRSGTSGSIRIVAQVQPAEGQEVGPVRFLIDGQLFGTDSDGPPYAVEWVDENPFERREIAVAIDDALGHEVRDRVVLEPFDIVEESQVSSVLVDAAVQDKNGRFLKTLPPSAFTLLEDGVPQKLDLAQQETVGSTFALLIDSSASMSRRLDFVQRTAGLLPSMSPLDRTIVAPFARNVRAITGPTDDRPTVAEAIRTIQTSGGTAILDSVIELARGFPESPGRRTVILITDGYDENSTSSVDEAIAALKKAQATVYAVGIGGVAGVSLKGEKMLRRLAAETGGRVFPPSTESQLELVHTALVDEVRNRYLLTYTPPIRIRMASGDVFPCMCRIRRIGWPRGGLLRAKARAGETDLEFTATDLQDRTVGHRGRPGIVEDGVPQHVETFHEASQPVSIILALDASGSMRRREAEVIASARAFATALRPRTSWRSCSLPTTCCRFRPDHEPCRQHRGDRQLQDWRRHGAVRRNRGSGGPVGSYRGTPRDRHDDRRP